MNPALLATFLSLFCALLIIRSLQKQLARSRSNCDVAQTLLQARNMRVADLEKQFTDLSNATHEHAASVGDLISGLTAKYDRLLGEKTQLEAMNTALKIELKRRHRRTRVRA